MTSVSAFERSQKSLSPAVFYLATEIFHNAKSAW